MADFKYQICRYSFTKKSKKVQKSPKESEKIQNSEQCSGSEDLVMGRSLLADS